MPDSHEPDTNPFDEDIWQSDMPVVKRRRRRRKTGPDPLVVGLSVMLMCVLGVGLFIVLTHDSDDEDTAAPESADTPPAERTAEQVDQVSSPARVSYQQLEEQEVPPQFTQAFAEAGRLIERAERDQANGRLNEAYKAYAEANELLKPLPDAIAQWQADQEVRAQAAGVLEEVKQLQSQAEQAKAEQYATAFSRGKLGLSHATASFDKGDYTDALSKAEEARGLFEQATEVAQEAAAALAASESLFQAMAQSPSEETLRKHAAEQIDRLNTLRQDGADKFTGRDYAASKQAYEDALAALRQAEELLELARYRKYYGYRAGHEAAGVLLAIAAGDEVDTTALSELFNRLQTENNPAAQLALKFEPDYDDAADALVNAARTAIIAKHGEAVQACYHAGFQVRIIEQSLATEALTKDQQQRIHQSLSVFQEQAAAGGWDIVRLRPAVELVRSANRRASLGKAPEQTREAFAVLIKPLESRASAARLMDPLLSPSSPDDPELFPGLGSSRP